MQAEATVNLNKGGISKKSSYGPLHSNGICLLDLPFLSQLKPIASTSSATAIPHVATAPDAPDPTSLPGGLIV
jgi:hypothetical protein